MSYILDALKKSDMQAKQGELPSIHSSHAGGLASAHRPGWQYALSGGAAVALLLGAGLIFLPASNRQPASSALQATSLPATAGQNLAPPATPGTEASMPPPAVSATSPANTISTTVSPPPAPGTNMPTALETADIPAPPADAQPTGPSTEPMDAPAAIPMPDIRPASQAEVPPRNKLPLDMQQALPPIDISGHIFDEQPAARMVFINGHIQREGDSISPGLTLLAITANGVEMSFRNTRFRIDLFHSRARGDN